LSELIARDHNRASLIIYSVANETPISDARNRFLSQLIQQAHSSDPTRLVSAALQEGEVRDGGRLSIRLNDPIASELDVPCVGQDKSAALPVDLCNVRSAILLVAPWDREAELVNVKAERGLNVGHV
jgi:hypothetical protein